MQIIPTDTDPSIFWVTNPDNTFTNNAAVGGRFGYPYYYHFDSLFSILKLLFDRFWFSLPSRPIGLTAIIGGFYPANYNPSQLPLKRFYNNTAHSSGEHCLFLFFFSTFY